MYDEWELSNSCAQWQTHRSRLIWKYHPSSLCMFGKFYFLFSENYSGAISQFLIIYLMLCIKHLSWVIITGLLRAHRKTNCVPALIYFSDLVGNYEVNKEMVEEMCQNLREPNDKRSTIILFCFRSCSSKAPWAKNRFCPLNKLSSVPCAKIKHYKSIKRIYLKVITYRRYFYHFTQEYKIIHLNSSTA